MLLIASNGVVLENNRTLPYGELWNAQFVSKQVAEKVSRKGTCVGKSEKLSKERQEQRPWKQQR